MKRFLLSAFVTMSALSTAHAAGMCSAPPLSCATTMPVGGYCECTAKGQTVDGTVMERPVRGKKVNSTAGGCGTNPNAPGCH